MGQDENEGDTVGAANGGRGGEEKVGGERGEKLSFV
jgi:hypothetical protein